MLIGTQQSRPVSEILPAISHRIQWLGQFTIILHDCYILLTKKTSFSKMSLL